jgi:arylsulfatase
MVAEFEAEASANYVYPIDNRDDRRTVSLPPDELADASLPRSFYPGTQATPGTVVSPMIADRDYVLRARFDWQAGHEGVVVAMGDHFCGMVLFVMNGALHFTYQLWYRPLELSPIPLAPGAQDFVLRYSALGERKGRGSFSVNGQLLRDAVDLSPTMVRLPSGGLSVGINRRRPISERYADRGTFRYTGAIDSVHIEPGPQPADTPMLLDEAAIQARMRAAAGVAGLQ